MTINIDKISTSKEILDSMTKCTKCGICHAYCPVASVTNLFPGPKYTGPQTQRFRKLENFDELSPELCNGCGICMSVCPNDVAITDIITLAKSNLTNTKKKIPLIQKILNRPDIIGKIGNSFPLVSNFILHNSFFRLIAEKFLNLSANAPMPKFNGKKFSKFIKNNVNKKLKKDIIYFTGCAVDNYDNNVGINTLKVLNYLNYNVRIKSDLCCSLPMISSGEWDSAIPRSKELIDSLFDSLRDVDTIVSTSTSCSLTIRKKYAAYFDYLNEKSVKVSNSINDICEYLIINHSEEIRENLHKINKKIFYHGPCQLKSHGMGQPALELLRMIPEIKIILSENECCGIGGTFGYLRDKNSISSEIGKTLTDQVKENKPDIILCDSETCRWNIEKLTNIKTVHPVEVISESLQI